MRIKLPERLTLTTFDSIYPQLSQLAPAESLELEMENLQFSEPGGLLPLTCVLRNHVKAGGNLVIRSFPSESVCGYLERMNFYRVIGCTCSHKPQARLTGDDRFIEVTEVSNSLSELTKRKLHSLVKGRIEIKDLVGESFLTACGELVQNTRHAYNVSIEPLAENWPSALVLAQYYRKTNALHFAVTDCGIGIYRSIGAKDPNLYKTEKHAIDAALVLGMKGPADRSGIGRGLGLAAIRRFMSKNGGRFSIRTGGCLAIITPHKREHNVSPWKGTVVSLEIRGGRTVDISDIIERMTKA